ncbi:hypothetical protein ABIF64_004686 [Bradyrhizobium japonicum]|jgi:hypothetical protein|uniref:Transposase n=1 Tax=Bradyrhizobium japonicum TaxID=375 RepID=A0ABV2S1V3_BRAJP|nr:hypothetical protein [Bradyrhizobium japonicum]MCP1789638.1 hypothetical protein [Bradyrhizobium japonicum]MCP1802134.1 hypothetical protein [Bradyrhizobium japonicum]MCP1820444.1 hypothetical protein [Bradyrhizobium japonicum]MCP1868048.1 hypothetical protein [Bradyrhizobium japonicum]
MPPEVAEILHKAVDEAGSNRSWRRRKLLSASTTSAWRRLADANVQYGP